MKKTQMRILLGSAIVCVAVSLLNSTARAQSATDLGADTWLGINHGNADQAMLLGDLKATGVHMVREGFNAEPNSTFAAKVDAYVAAGIDAHVSLNMRGHSIDVSDYPTWLKNYKQRCIDIMSAYKGKIHYYIIGNEPDKRDPDTGRLTPQQAVDFTQMAFEASRQVDPTGGIKIVSPPLSSPRPIRNYFRLMLAAGLLNYCDYIGIHVYSNQVNDGRMDDPWKAEQELGGPQRPIAVSECGTSTDWGPKTFTLDQKQQWKADFLAQAYVQLKRYGFANVIFFNSSDSSKWPATFDILRDGTPDRTIIPATYDELKNNFKPTPLRDAGFEEPNDFKHEWVVYHDPTFDNWDTSAFNFQAPGGHSGATALQIDTTHKGPLIARQVVSGITPGTPITITAWAFSNSAEGATLKAEGYNATAGNQETADATKTKGNWEQLSVTLNPTNPWVVIELSAPTKTAAAGSYVKFDDVALVTREK
jgi:hypothetical protein